MFEYICAASEHKRVLRKTRIRKFIRCTGGFIVFFDTISCRVIVSVSNVARGKMAVLLIIYNWLYNYI